MTTHTKQFKPFSVKVENELLEWERNEVHYATSLQAAVKRVKAKYENDPNLTVTGNKELESVEYKAVFTHQGNSENDEVTVFVFINEDDKLSKARELAVKTIRRYKTRHIVEDVISSNDTWSGRIAFGSIGEHVANIDYRCRLDIEPV
ncbi:hypothetical protein [Pseudoalteromonas sp. Of11M-6]|uniref:hypothetical protein n=1 Tax=Pseudoalteromonas sp. Of11M-6 TaxID=2917754 RepID=UPI001EF4276B|nr:hypothetical protein [Pseudoalteromonas sp. Of11M-6]MCG7556337.1 hypothetical protein [Pseudoalteromonas sp. Of11M-6]